MRGGEERGGGGVVGAGVGAARAGGVGPRMMVAGPGAPALSEANARSLEHELGLRAAR